MDQVIGFDFGLWGGFYSVWVFGEEFCHGGLFSRHIGRHRKRKGEAMAVKADYCDVSASSPSTNRGTKASLDSGPQNRGIHRKPEDDQIKPPAHLSAIRGG